MPKRSGTSFGSARKRKKAPVEQYWEIQALLDCRKEPDTGAYEYLIRWRNWDGDDTWEPEANLSDTVKQEAELVKSRYLERVDQQVADAQGTPLKDDSGKGHEEPLGTVGDQPKIATPGDSSTVTESLPSSQFKTPPTANSKKNSVTLSGDSEQQYEKITGSSGAVASPPALEEPVGNVTTVNEPRAPEDSSMLGSEQPTTTLPATAKANDAELPGTNAPEEEADKAAEPNVSKESDLHTPSTTFKSAPTVAASAESAENVQSAASYDSTGQSNGEKESPQKAADPKDVSVLKEARRLRGLWTMIARDLETKVSEKHSATVQALSKLYPALQYPKLALTEHCVFCHKSFDPRFPEGCRMLHVIEKWTPSKRVGDDVYVGQCSRCSESWEASRCYMETLSKSSCFERKHTSDIKERLGLSLEYDNLEGKRRAAALKKSALKPFDGCSKCRVDAEE